MNRFTLFLALLCMCIGVALGQIAAVSDLNNTTAYTIKSINRGFIYYVADPGTTEYLWSSLHTTLTDTTLGGSKNQWFAFLRGICTAAGSYCLYRVPAAKFAGQSVDSYELMLSEQPAEAITFAQATKNSVAGFVVEFSNGKSINITNWQAVHRCKVITAALLQRR